MKNRKWLLIPAVVVLILMILAAVFWQSLTVYLAPKMVLADALKNSIDSLEDRFASGPAAVLARGLDPEGNNRVALELDTYNDFAGNIRYDMDVQIMRNPKRILASGKAGFQNTEMDLSLYLDSDFAAVSSAEILGGRFYGLNYDSFSRDIRSNRLIAAIIGEKVLQNWESRVAQLQTVMAQDLPEMPDLSGVDLKSLAMAVLALDADVERVRIDANGSKETYHVISFPATGEDIALGLSYLNLRLPELPDHTENIVFSFWLKERKICKISVAGEKTKLDLYMGIAPHTNVSDDDLYLQYFDGQDMTTVTIQTVRSGQTVRETVTYTGSEKIVVSYDWIPTVGDLLLTVEAKGERTDLKLKLVAVENGFSAEVDDFGALMHLLAGTRDSGDHSCTMTVTKGTSFASPEYKNFVDWSTEDLLVLLSGFGSLLGLEIS